MAEAFGLIASCVSIVQGLDAICTFIRENIHRKESVREELTFLVGKVSSYRGIIFGIQLQAELDKVSHDRLSALDQVSGPLEACELATNLINKRLQNLPKRLVFGKVIDKETAESLKVLDNALPVLQLALHADQRVITAEVEKYVKAIKEDLSSMRSDNEAMRENVSGIKEIITDQRTRQDGEKREEEKRKLIEWLTKCHPRTTYLSCLDKASPGSGRWFLDYDFHDWLERRSGDTPRVMWLRGESGAGKTTLLSLAICYLRGLKTGGDAPLCAYFYCTFSAKESQSASNMIGSYIVQLYDQVPGLDEIVKSLQAESKSRQNSELKGPLMEDLERTLSQALGMTNKVIVLFLDAPNESDTADEMLEALSRLVRSHGNLQVLISSTADIDLRQMLQAYSGVMVIEASYRNVNADICVYVEARMRHERRLRKLPQHFKDKIRDSLASNAKGSFRWAECQITSLVEKAWRSEAAIEDALHSVSPSLEGLYTSALLATSPTDRPLLRSALLWLTFAIRPLDVRELGEAMIFNGQSVVIDPAKRLFLEGVEDILRNCRMLINYNADSGYATLAHSSVQQFLISEQCKSSPAEMFHFDESEDLCALSCLAVDYLNMPCFASGYCPSKDDSHWRLVDWPLLKYVSDAWPVYMRVMSWPLSATRYRTERALQQFFGSASWPRGGNFGSWVQVYIPRHLRLNQTLSHPLYYAARAGMAEVVRMILRVEGKGALELQGGSRQSTPLHVACAYGRTATVKLLLEEGADPNERNGKGERGIEWAEYHHYHDIVELLLQHGATPVEPVGLDRLKRMIERH